jgi:hypothetical protein
MLLRNPAGRSVLLALLLAGPSPALAQSDCCKLLGGDVAERYRVTAIEQRRFTHRELWRALRPYLATGGVRVTDVARSIQGRDVRAVTFGSGSTTVLLWSQMHGDESTATMALADVIRFFADGGDDPLRARIEERLTVVMVPMLNPDGAERFQRYNAVGVDVNRDARRLATPEGRALKALRDSLKPAFGFNLHDQNARTTAGPSGAQAAIALLAPAADSARSWTPIRSRARRLAALVAAGIGTELPGRVAKYDDTFTPRAFGDLMQQWGTSTVLIESGALPDDPEKQALRRINVMAILTALDGIARGSYESTPLSAYDSLPFNARVSTDLLLMGGDVVIPTGPPLRLDLALLYDDPVARTGLTLGEVGDLDDVAAMDTVDVRGLFLHVTSPGTLYPRAWWLLRGEPVAIVVRRGPSPETEIVMRFPH